MRIYRSIIVSSFLVLTVFVNPIKTYAATLSNSNLITVVPSLVSLDLQNDKPEVDYYYRNGTNETILLTLSATDFKPLEDGYKIAFIEGKEAERYTYRLSSWITFEKNALIIPAHTTEKVKIYITKDTLTPGGHYATIMANFSEKPEKGDVQIQGVLTSFLFVRTNTGKETEEAIITSVIPLQEWFGFPGEVSLRFQNTGNTELIPHGIVEIKDPFGNITGSGIINDASSMALPESIKRYTIPVHTTTTILLPGMYTIDAQLHFGKSNKLLSARQSFFSLGSPVVTLGILIVCVVPLTLPYFLRRRKIK